VVRASSDGERFPRCEDHQWCERRQTGNVAVDKAVAAFVALGEEPCERCGHSLEETSALLTRTQIAEKRVAELQSQIEELREISIEKGEADE
jgi:hypothetical protein